MSLMSESMSENVTFLEYDATKVTETPSSRMVFQAITEDMTTEKKCESLMQGA